MAASAQREAVYAALPRSVPTRSRPRSRGNRGDDMRRLALLILTFEMLLVQDAGPLAASEKENRPALVRVRSENPSIANLIRDATGSSTTFRGLIETIGATDGLVYVDEGACGNSVRACLVLSVKVAGPFRLLRVLVNSRGKTDCALMASIGHELQHAIEVLRDPHVTDMHSAYAFFDREGPTGRGRFETLAAFHVGHHVGLEACAHEKSR
jgi:hypothetical protein